MPLPEWEFKKGKVGKISASSDSALLFRVIV